MAGDTRTRMINAAITASRRRDVAGMSATEILDATGAARPAASGVERDEADPAATLSALWPGAHVRCRAAGTLAPFDRAERTAADVVRHRDQARRTR
jgi:hypothetical protein